MIAKPFSPGNAFPAEEVARERITFDKAMIGSCTNGSYDDLLQAALVLRAARGAGARTVARELVRSSRDPAASAGRSRPPDPRLGGESIAEVFRSVGGQIRQSWCGPCFGQGPDALTPGQRAITSFNRNWQNRMGFGGEGYLASPAVVAASALARLHGAAERARPGVGRRAVRRVAVALYLARRSPTCARFEVSPNIRSRRGSRPSPPFARHRPAGPAGSLVHLDRGPMDWITDPQIWIALAHADVPRDRARRRQHHLHLDPVGKAAAGAAGHGAPRRPAWRDADPRSCCCSRSPGSSG